MSKKSDPLTIHTKAGPDLTKVKDCNERNCGHYLEMLNFLLHLPQKRCFVFLLSAPRTDPHLSHFFLIIRYDVILFLFFIQYV